MSHAIVPISVMRTGAPTRILRTGVVIVLIAGVRMSIWVRIVALFPEDDNISLLGTTIIFVRCQLTSERDQQVADKMETCGRIMTRLLSKD